MHESHTTSSPFLTQPQGGGSDTDADGYTWGGGGGGESDRDSSDNWEVRSARPTVNVAQPALVRDRLPHVHQYCAWLCQAPHRPPFRPNHASSCCHQTLPRSRPQSAMSVVSTSSALSDVGLAESHVFRGVDRRWRTVFQDFRSWDRRNTSHVPIHVFTDILTRAGSPLGSTELQAVLDKYRKGSRINYVAFMRNVRAVDAAVAGAGSAPLDAAPTNGATRVLASAKAISRKCDPVACEPVACVCADVPAQPSADDAAVTVQDSAAVAHSLSEPGARRDQLDWPHVVHVRDQPQLRFRQHSRAIPCAP